MEKSIKWLKLLLLNEDEIQYDEIRNWRIRQGQRLHELGTTAVDVVSTFLRKIWSHTLNRLKVVLAFSLLPLRVAITVPAIWPPYAERAMRQAAQMAGILDKRDAGETLLRLVQEPEAAGLHFLLEMQPDVHVRTQTLTQSYNRLFVISFPKRRGMLIRLAVWGFVCRLRCRRQLSCESSQPAIQL